MPANCNVHARGTIAVVELGGPGFSEEEAFALAHGVLDHVVDMGANGVIVSLARVGSFTSLGLGALVNFRRLLTARGCPLVLADVPEKIGMLFKVARLARLFTFAPSVEAAVLHLEALGRATETAGA